MAAHGRRASLVWFSLMVLSGCASASNAKWLQEPERGFSAGERLFAPNGSQTVGVASEAPPPRPRLRQTVTLGETTAPGPEPSAAAAASRAAPVSVNVNRYVTVPATTYGGWSDPRPSPVVTPRGEPSQPAGSWPSPPSYGPSFPFKSGPASPWR